MARTLFSTPNVAGPLDTAKIDSVTHQDHDHLMLWKDTNNALAQHTSDIAKNASLIATLQAQIAALNKKLGIT